jgi:hypothetical protein
LTRQGVRISGITADTGVTLASNGWLTRPLRAEHRRGRDHRVAQGGDDGLGVARPAPAGHALAQDVAVDAAALIGGKARIGQPVGVVGLRRYITRPALANERVQTNAAGQVVLKLKTAWRDGTTHLVMSPLEFMQRLAALVPRPRLHLIRFHGVLAPNAKLRAMVVPQEPEPPAPAAVPAQCEASCTHHRPVRLSWASLAGRAGPVARPSPGTDSPLDCLCPGSATQAHVRDRHGALPELRQ